MGTVLLLLMKEILLQETMMTAKKDPQRGFQAPLQNVSGFYTNSMGAVNQIIPIYGILS
jgi:hypothetical protein